MGNVIPWSQIHPSITSEEPFVAVVIVDPQRQICISELVPFDEQSLRSPEVAAQEMIGAVQAAAARVASGYRTRRKDEPSLQVLQGGAKRRASKAPRRNPTLNLWPVE
ncbi:MAG TPA: hypothetical protein VII89_00565 [Candidatus Dormibacteraeota bacterium]